MQAASGRDDHIKDLPKFFLCQKEARQNLEETTPRPRHTHEVASSHTAVFAGLRQGEAIKQH